MIVNTIEDSGLDIITINNASNSYLGGPCDVCCPNCTPDRLLCIACIDFNELSNTYKRLKINDHIMFLYCWNCTIKEGDFVYRCHNDRIDIIKYKNGVKSIHNNNYIIPKQYVHFKLINSINMQLIDALNKMHTDDACSEHVDNNWQHIKRHNLLGSRDQLGGIPRILSGNYGTHLCVQCNSDLLFMATFAHRDYSNSYKPNIGVQLLYKYCANCKLVYATHEVD